MAEQENKKITVSDFVKKYKQLSSDSLKERLIKSIIIRTYVPVLEKKLFLQVMFDKSLVGEEPNRHVDMFLNSINVTLAILGMYTKLNFEKTEENKTTMFEAYDMLAELDLLNIIFNEIPSSELTQISAINEQIMETYYNEHNSMQSFATKLVDRFANTFGVLTKGSIDSLSDVLNDEEKLNSVIDKLNKDNKLTQIAKRFMK